MTDMTPREQDKESDRLRVLRDLAILDTAEEEAFDRITRVAASLFGVPIALVSLVDEQRQWFKSRVGMDTCETDRDISFCAHALGRNEPLVVEDARSDPRFSENPQVTGPPHIRFYAGAQLRTSSGFDLGTLCVIDVGPRRRPPAEQLQILTDLADTATLLIEQRRLAHELVRENERRRAAETEAVRAKEEAHSANLLMHEVFRRLAHDVRTPLGSVLGYADLLREADLNEQQRQDLREIHVAGKKMAAMVDELLEVSRRELQPDDPGEWGA